MSAHSTLREGPFSGLQPKVFLRIPARVGGSSLVSAVTYNLECSWVWPWNQCASWKTTWQL